MIPLNFTFRDALNSLRLKFIMSFGRSRFSLRMVIVSLVASPRKLVTVTVISTYFPSISPFNVEALNFTSGEKDGSPCRKLLKAGMIKELWLMVGWPVFLLDHCTDHAYVNLRPPPFCFLALILKGPQSPVVV